MKTTLLALIMIGTSATAMAAKTTKIKCHQIDSVHGYSEIYEFKLNSKKEILTVDSTNWNDKENKIAGSGSTYYAEKEHLVPEAVEDVLIYKYTFQDEGDVDYPGPVTDVRITLPQTLKGPATVELIYDDGHQGYDNFELDCK